MSIKSSIKSKAVIIGCDDRQFWLFNWWYNNYRRFNNNLVVFVDFGLSERNLRIVRDAGIFEFITIKPELTMRGAKIWFYKPQAMLMSSCDYNLWLDLDTEVRGDLSPVLAYLDTHAIAASLDHFNTVNHQPTDHPSVNTGVFAFRKGYKLIKRWDEVCQQELALNTIRGDQEVLHEILMGRTTTEGCATDKGQVKKIGPVQMVALPHIYNRLRLDQFSSDDVVRHYTGETGKGIIARHIAKQVQQAKQVQRGVVFRPDQVIEFIQPELEENRVAVPVPVVFAPGGREALRSPNPRHPNFQRTIHAIPVKVVSQPIVKVPIIRQ